MLEASFGLNERLATICVHDVAEHSVIKVNSHEPIISTLAVQGAVAFQHGHDFVIAVSIVGLHKLSLFN